MAELLAVPMPGLDSRLQFLEEVLPNKDWRTSIVFQDSSDTSLARLAEMKAMLEQRRYIVNIAHDDRQRPLLQIHHIGRDTTLLSILQERGIGSATKYMAAHPGAMLGKAGDGIVKTARELSSDPARLNGFAFTLAELFLTSAGLFNKKDPIPKNMMPLRKRANLLQSIAGSLFLGQSLTYLLLARSNDEMTMDQIRGKVNERLKSGSPIEHIGYNAQADKPDSGPLGQLSSFIRKYPIQIGAMFNVTGMFVYIGHVLTEKKLFSQVQHMKVEDLAALNSKSPQAMAKATVYLKEAVKYIDRGWKFGIAGCVASIVAWSMLLLPHKQKKEAEKKKREVGDFIGHLKDNPQLITGSMAVTSSTLRLIEGIAKRNPVQIIGEGIYIPGDLLLMLIHNDEYGEGSKGQDKLVKRLSEYMHQLPVALGPQSQKDFVTHLGEYLQDKAIADTSLLPPEQRVTPEQIAQDTQRLVNNLRLKLSQLHDTPFDLLVDNAVRVVNHYPPELRAPLRDRMAETLAQLPQVRASVAELQAALEQHVPIRTETPIAPRDLAGDIGALSSTVPQSNVAKNALLLKDMLAEFTTRATPRPSSKISLTGRIVESPQTPVPAHIAPQY